MTNAKKYHRTISPRSTRDLRAEVADLAATLITTEQRGVLVIKDRRLSPQTILSEWERLLKAFTPDLQSRLTLELLEPEFKPRMPLSTTQQTGAVMLGPPNFRFEVMRQLMGADIDQIGAQSVEQLVKRVGASQFTVRKVLAELVQRGLVRQSNPTNARFSVTATDIDLELLGVAQALPQTLSFRYAVGTHPRSTEELIKRFEQLMQPDVPDGWKNIGLSGSSATNLLRLRAVNLFGAPRVDLTAYVGKATKRFDVSLIQQLDSGFEYVPDVRWPASLVVTIVRSDPKFNHPEDAIPWRSAKNSDIYHALLDAGLREQAIQFATNGGKGR